MSLRERLLNMDTDERIRMQYIGLLNFVAENAVHWSNPDGQEARGILEQILDDAKDVLPGFEWNRVLDSFEVEFVE